MIRLTPTAASTPGSGEGPRVEVTWDDHEVTNDPWHAGVGGSQRPEGDL